MNFSRYIVHWLLHHIRLFWRFHKIHHSDPDYDFTISFRFHPLEILLGAANTLIIIRFLGVPVIGVIIAELLVVGINFFTHTNVRLPPHWKVLSG